MAPAPTAPAQPKVPLIASGPISEFGAFEPDEQYFNAVGQDRDGTYVPGFSDLRRAYDKALGQFKRGEIARADIPTLPVNLRWARNQNRSGTPDSAKPFAHARKGYRMVTESDIGEPWLQALPGGAMIDAAKNIRNGDTVLMVATAKDAGRNKALRERETEARLTGVTNEVAAAHLREAPKGAEPYVKQEKR